VRLRQVIATHSSSKKTIKVAVLSLLNFASAISPFRLQSCLHRMCGLKLESRRFLPPRFLRTIPAICPTVILLPSRDHATATMSISVQMRCKETQARERLGASPAVTPTAVLSPVIESIVPLGLEWNSMLWGYLEVMSQTFRRANSS
jgi:hypothetical protein